MAGKEMHLQAGHTAFAVLVAIGLVVSACSGDEPSDAETSDTVTDTGVNDAADGADGETCETVCPEGSTVSMLSRTLCEDAPADGLLKSGGLTTGLCLGEGECQLLCQLEEPCQCGLSILSLDPSSNEPLTCNACEATCGNGECEAEELVMCPEDCAEECTPEDLRCVGNVLQECTSDGSWDAGVECADNQVCQEDQNEGVVECVLGCTTGESRCAAAGLTPAVQRCSELGFWLLDLELCGLGEECVETSTDPQKAECTQQ